MEATWIAARTAALVTVNGQSLLLRPVAGQAETEAADSGVIRLNMQ
jgi:hypothetical protein